MLISGQLLAWKRMTTPPTQFRRLVCPGAAHRRFCARKPPGFLRVDTVHQGDHNGTKGVYHINTVDEITQYQQISSVEAISKHLLIPVLEALIAAYPFLIQGFHADNGSEYINHRDTCKANPFRASCTGM